MSNSKLRHLRTYESMGLEADDKSKAESFLGSITGSLLYVVDVENSDSDPFEVTYVFGVDQPAFDGTTLDVKVSITCEPTGDGEAASHGDPGSAPTFDRDYDFALNRVAQDGDTLLDAVALTEVPNVEALKQLVSHHLQADIDWEKYEQLAWNNR
jgi:hypothetical protein